MTKQYAHSLLFVCPNCKLPILVSGIGEDQDPKNLDAQYFAATCSYCRQSFNIPGADAKKHYVDEWPQ